MIIREKKSARYFLKKIILNKNIGQVINYGDFSHNLHRIRCTGFRCTLQRSQLSSRPITSEPVPIPPFCKRLQIAWMVVSTVHVRNMRYVVGRDRQTATGQLIINIIYLFDNLVGQDIFPTFRTRMRQQESRQAMASAAMLGRLS